MPLGLLFKMNIFLELPFERVWLPFIYLYGIGGLFFFIGLWLVVRSGALRSSGRGAKRWIQVLLFGFFWYMLIHGGATLMAIF